MEFHRKSRVDETYVTVYQAKVKCINLFLHGIEGWRIVGILSRRSRGSGSSESSVSLSMPPLGGVIVVVSVGSNLKGTMESLTPLTVEAVEWEGTDW